MSGLVRRPHFEEVLDAAIKDLNSTHGILSVGMQRFATNAINNPLYQRVKATMEANLEGQERNLLEAKVYDQNLRRASMDAKLPHADYKWAAENLNPPPPPAPPPPPSDTKIDYARVAAEMDAVMQRRAVETSHQTLAADVARELSKQSVATPAQQIIREHHHHFITQPISRTAPTGFSADAKRVGKSVHEKFLEKASSSTDIPIQYNTPRVSSTEFPDELMRQQVVPRGSVKKERPASQPTPRGPTERTGSAKQLKTKFEQPKVVEQSSIRAAAIKHMVAIADRANQETTKHRDFAKRVVAEKKKRRGGAPGDVVQTGVKRKEFEPDMPRSILRKSQQTSNSRQRVYGPNTKVFDIAAA